MTFLRKQLTSLQRDVFLTALFIVVLFVLFHYLDAFESLYSLTRAHEDWEADELVMFFLALPIPLMWFALRRVRDGLRVAQQQAALEASLAHARKLESLGTLAGGVAHEINNQLTPVLSMTELLIKQLAPDDPAGKKLRLIQRGAESARDTVLRIKDFARLDAPSVGGCDVLKTLEYTREVVTHFTPSSIRVDFDLDLPDVRVGVNCADLEALVINLVNNAIDAIGRGSVGTIFLSAARISGRMAGEVAPSHFVRITLSDTGHGMSPEVQQRIFDPFYTTKAVGKGMGLGLSTLHSIVQAAGGKVTVDSQPEQGARFSVELPLAE